MAAVLAQGQAAALVQDGAGTGRLPQVAHRRRLVAPHQALAAAMDNGPPAGAADPAGATRRKSSAVRLSFSWRT